MSLPDLSVKRPTAISMFFIGIVLIGIIAFKQLPVEMMPNVSFGDITINIDVRGGIPASEIEKRITILVEEAVGSVSHLKNILSISKEGNSTVILEFYPGTDMDFAALEVREKFNRIRNDLPSEIEKPVIAKYEYMDMPIVILAVTSDIRTPEDIRKIVDQRIKERIQRIEGVASAEIAGGREGKILIEVDQSRLQAYSLSIIKLVNIISLNNSNLLAGEIKRLKDKYMVRTIGEFEDLSDIENLAIMSTSTGSVVRVKDVAKVKDSYLDPSSFARLNARPVVSIYVQKESLGNTVKIASLIEKEIKLLHEILDKDIKVTPTFNQAETINQAVDQVKSSLAYGAILATIVLIFFLWDLRTVFIIASSIPLSVLLTFSLMYFTKLTINVMTLSGLALGVGMLVDNAIVVLDNIFKKRDEIKESKPELLEDPAFEKDSRENAACLGANEMFLAITASTLTTIIVFLPLVWINQEIKMLYSGIALTITFSLLASLLSAITLVPMLASRLRLKPKKTDQALANTDGAVITPPAPKPPKIKTNFYKSFISFILIFRYLIFVLVAAACLRVFQESKKLEREFIGIAEQNKFTIFIEMPTGTRLEVSDKIVAQVERLLSRIPEIKTATAKIDPWSSKIYVELVPLTKRQKTTGNVIEELRPLTEKLDPAFIYYEEPEDIGTKEILLELYGYDYDILKNLAIKTAQKLQSIPRFTDTKIRMREGRPELQLIIDKRQAAFFGLQAEEIAFALHAYMRGLVSTRFRGESTPIVRLKGQNVAVTTNASTPEEELKVIQQKLRQFRGSSMSETEEKETETIVRLEEKFRKTFDALRRISFVTPDKQQVFLSQLADFRFDIGPSEVWRKNKSRMVQVSANTGGQALGTAAYKVKEAMKDLQFPRDYFWQLGGNYDKMIQNQQELSFALLLSLILVYMILASLFESFSQPFIILMTVPLAAIGAIMALRYANKPIGIGVLIGAIMLGGIVVNNAIVLIDRINFLRDKHPDFGSKTGARKAVVEASFDRLRPIMMTSLTTILGLIPMALDKSESANLWSPLAITVIGGMTVSTFLTLFVIPCIYMIFRDLKLVRN